ncbi:MAG: hypothetical protein HW383_848, partial [Candidatus Magasanikbacteria bacterium]|nr:hypothetical protein [Candidatus Magasanikbacteria bacterium]
TAQILSEGAAINFNPSADVGAGFWNVHRKNFVERVAGIGPAC